MTIDDSSKIAIDETAALAQLRRLAPFVRRAGLAVTGREKLSRMGGGRIRLIICTRDLSENSLKEIHNDCPNIPLYQAFSSTELSEVLGLDNAKIVGLKSNGLSSQIADALEAFRLNISNGTQGKKEESV